MVDKTIRKVFLFFTFIVPKRDSDKLRLLVDLNSEFVRGPSPVLHADGPPGTSGTPSELFDFPLERWLTGAVAGGIYDLVGITNFGGRSARAFSTAVESIFPMARTQHFGFS